MNFFQPMARSEGHLTMLVVDSYILALQLITEISDAILERKQY